ncbi:hypothetical protein KC722_02820 [Candidatus Kaiserbacteria bacterium]|nr:hypothetical protein [Candidatus Kaiserbacteria bacterium]MCB9811675.1 hypothetical protein [Candidatus Nomurabacteria bacterium]
MKFLYGATRWVILVGPVALKIARFRPYRLVARLFVHARNGEVRMRLDKFDSRSKLVAVCRYIGAGVSANRAEYHLYREDERLRLIPVKSIWFWGLVLVQSRGDAIPHDCAEEATSHPMWSAMLEEAGSANKALKQFCLFNGRPHLADYGRWDLEGVIKTV